MDLINSISPTELTILANVVSLIIAEGKTADELNILGSFITTVGDLVSMIAAQKENLQTIQDKQQSQSSKKQN
jgi:Sec-independent protein translocase protein TatA